MGSSGEKRKGRQHLPKVGTKTETNRLMREEHGAIADTMGIGHSGKGGRSAVFLIGGILLALAVISLIILTVALS